MGVLIKCSDTEFTNYIGIADYPILSSLKNLYYFGGTQAESIKDHSGNGNDGTVSGSITVNSHTITFSGTGTEDKITAQNPTEGTSKITALALFKKTGKRGLVQNGAGTSSGFALGTERSLYFSGSFKDMTYTLPDSTGFYILALVVGADGGTVYRSVSDSAVGVLAHNDAANVLPSAIRSVNFGGTGYNWSMNGSADIAVAAYYEDALTVDQLKDTFGFLRLYAEKYNLTLA